MRERVVCQLRIKNERRFIYRCVESAWAVAENVVIFDDGSSDGTDIEAARACLERELEEDRLPIGARKIPWGWRLEGPDRRILHYLYSPFTESVRPNQRVNEIRDKQILLEYLKACIPAEIVLNLDGDEMLSNQAIINFPKAIELLESNDWLEVPVIYLWDREDQIRVDGIYASPRHPRIFTFKHLLNDELFALRYGWSSAGGGFHCGSVPKDGLGGRSKLFNHPIVHFGYIDEQLRNRKFEFYNRIDPGNKSEGEYRHIIGIKDHLCPDPVKLKPWIDSAPLPRAEKPASARICFIVPSRTDKLLGALLTSIDSSNSHTDFQIVVADNGLSPDFTAWAREYFPVLFVPIPEPFNFAVAINRAVEASDPGTDILIINDDVVIESEGFVRSMQSALEQARREAFGIISPVIEGGVGNTDQGETPPAGQIRLTRRPICFVAAAIPREIWTQVGLMDERFVGYGFEDVDYSRRVVEAGWKVGVTGAGRVRHGTDAIPFSTTFRQHKNLAALSDLAGRLFAEKWGGGNQMGPYEDASLAVSGLTLLQDLTLAKAPPHILKVGKGTDIEADIQGLWAAAKLAQPALSIEIGTRVGGPSTRAIADAIKSTIRGDKRRFIAVDSSAASSRASIGGCQYIQSEGQLFLDTVNEELQFLFIDVDPHGYEDTLTWLNWMERLLARGGYAAFHDIVENRPEIKVRAAIRDWLKSRENWECVEMDPGPGAYRHPQGGLAVLRRL